MATTFIKGHHQYRVKQLRDNVFELRKRHDEIATHTFNLSTHQYIADGLTLSSVTKEDFGTTTSSLSTTSPAFTFTVTGSGKVKFTLTFSNANTLEIHLVVKDITSPFGASDYD